VAEVSAGFIERSDPVEFRGRTSSELGKLREDEPHPVAMLRSGAQFGDCLVDHALLGGDEALEIIWIWVGHAAIMAVGRPAGKSGSRLLSGREQPCEYVEQDHHRAGQ